MATTGSNPTPALPPPPGQVSNFVDPPTLMTPVIIGVVFVLTTLTSMVAIRAYTKIVILRETFLEDVLAYAAWAGVCTYSGILTYMYAYGFARHQWDITPAMLSHIIYYLNILYCLYSPITLAAKLSVLFQIKRLFRASTRDAVYWVVVISIILNTIFYFGLFFAFVFQCWPREAIWNPNVKGKCTNGVESDFASGILNLISDVEALIIPAWAIWHLRMPIRKKLSIYGVFAVGAMAVGIGCVGMYFRVLLLHDKDFTWVCSQAAMLIISEMAAVVIVGCTPTLPRFWRHISGNTGRRASYAPPDVDFPSSGRRKGSAGNKPDTLFSVQSLSMNKYIGPRPKDSSSHDRLEAHSYDRDSPDSSSTSAPPPPPRPHLPAAGVGVGVGDNKRVSIVEHEDAV